MSPELPLHREKEALLSEKQRMLELLKSSSCFRGDVCSLLPCACAETLAHVASERNAKLVEALQAEIRARTTAVDGLLRKEARNAKLVEEISILREALRLSETDLHRALESIKQEIAFSIKRTAIEGNET